MSKIYNVYAKQIPQVSATGDDGQLNIHLKCWIFADLEDLFFNSVDDCGIMEVEKTVKFNKSDVHLMNVLKNKEITHYKTVHSDMLFPINSL
jgi:hypothetical protein